MWWKDPITLATIVIAGAAVLNFFVTRRLWEATKRTAEIARLVFEAGERPHVGISSIGVKNNQKDKILSFSVRLQNFGKIPATQMKASWEDFKIGDLPITRENKYPENEGAVVFPGVVKTKSESVKDKAYDAIFQGIAKLQFSILITYLGSRGDKYWTREVLVFDPKLKLFVPLKGEVGKGSPS